MKERIAADARKAWADWLERKKAQAEAMAVEVIAAAVEAVRGDFAPFIKWMAAPANAITSGTNAGRTWFDVLFGMYKADVRARRMKEMPSGVRDAGKDQRTRMEPEELGT